MNKHDDERYNGAPRGSMQTIRVSTSSIKLNASTRLAEGGARDDGYRPEDLDAPNPDAGKTRRIERGGGASKATQDSAEGATRIIERGGNGGATKDSEVGETVHLNREQSESREKETRIIDRPDDRTQVIRDKKETLLPRLNPGLWVQGWLVVTVGPMKGRFFPITYGNNLVGSSPDCRIILDGDSTISKKQAIISYDVETKETTMGRHADGTQPTRIVRADGSKEVLVNSIILKRGDTIRFSKQTEARYVPLCGESFDWDYTADGVEISAAHGGCGGTIIVEPFDLHNRDTVKINRHQTDGHTVMFRPENHTQPMQCTPDQWVQGWLVAVSGPMQGRSFPITYGFNHVGRAKECRICLNEDPGISARQISILYDEEENEALVNSHSDSTQVTRLRTATGERKRVEASSCVINNGDELVMTRDTTLRYVPFCDELFCWDY